MNKVATTRLSRAVADFLQAEKYIAEAQRILKALERDRMRNPLPGRRKVSIVDEMKAILGKK